MAEIVNLNQFRKKRERLESVRSAAENRSRFGQKKDDRKKVQHEREKLEKELDDKRLD